MATSKPVDTFATPEGARPNQIQVLVVDDEPMVRGFISRVLTRNGYSCRTASDAGEAIAFALSEPPVLTISDVCMPGHDGTWLLGELKKRWPDMAVIMLTADSEAETAVRCLQLGAEDYLVKPINLEELLISAQRAAEKRRLKSEALENQHRLAVVQTQTNRLQEALKVIDATYQDAISALLNPESAVRSDAAMSPETKGTAHNELTTLREAARLVVEGTAYAMVASKVVQHLVEGDGLIFARVLGRSNEQPGMVEIASRGELPLRADEDAERTIALGKLHFHDLNGLTTVALPIFAKNFVSGVLQLGWSAAQDSYAVAVTERLGLMLSVAQARDQDAIERSRTTEQLNLFYKLAAASRHSLELEHVAEFLMGSLDRIVDYDVAGLLLLDDDPSLTIQTRFHADSEFVQRVVSHIVTNLRLTCGVEAPENLAIRMREITSSRERPAPSKLRSFVNAPLTVAGSTVGLIHVSSGLDHAFGEEEVHFIDRAATFLAGSVQGVRELVAAVKGRVERMVDHMTDGVLMLDSRGRVVAMNGAARTVFRVAESPIEEPAPDRLTELLGFDPLALMDAEGNGLKRLVCLGGVSYQAQVSPVVDEAGHRGGAVLAFRNFEDEKRIDEMKSELVNVVSHELRTPLTATKNALSLLHGDRLGALTEQQRHFLNLAERNVEQLIGTINDLLDLSKIESGQMFLELEDVLIQEPIQAAVNALTLQAEQESVGLSCEIASDLPVIRGNAAALERVLFNLIGNAVKFTEGGGTVRVTAAVEEERDSHGEPASAVQVRVIDSGVGIPPDQLEAVFDKFHQVRGENRHAMAPGTGLGLPISRELVRMHHGRLWAESQEGEGSRFTFAIPVLDDAAFLTRALSVELARAGERDEAVSLVLIQVRGTGDSSNVISEDRLVALTEELRTCAGHIVRRASDQVLVLRDARAVAVILPRTPRVGATSFHGRLGDEISKSCVAEEAVEVAVSLAVFPEDATSAEALLAFAEAGHAPTLSCGVS